MADEPNEPGWSIPGRVRLSPDQTWQLIADADAQALWLGSDSRVHLAHGGCGSIEMTCDVFVLGNVVDIDPGRWVALSFDVEQADGSVSSSVVRIEVAPMPPGPTVVTISGPAPHADGAAVDLEAFWKGALDRLQRVASKVRKRLDRPRQAVVVVHGIGEQEPGATLKNFVGALGLSKSDTWRSKPDELSQTFELRKMVIGANRNKDRPITDVYEMYWAHLVRDTTMDQVSAWVTQLLLRRHVPPRYRGAQIAGLVLAAVWLALGAIIAVGIVSGDFGLPSVLATIGGLLLYFVRKAMRSVGTVTVTQVVGDAARYLAPRPANIERRQVIREAGVDLLDKLHRDCKYDRIVMVGHSLGTVIAYDVLTQYWIKVHREHARLAKVSNASVVRLERALPGAPDEVSGAVEAQVLQHEAWDTARANGQPWLVSDLVTLASPLSSAGYLMSHSYDDFRRAKSDRALPTCPPEPEVRRRRRGAPRLRLGYETNYTDRFGDRDRTLTTMHHAALFGLTRWTNIYFPVGLLKEPVGGPVTPELGGWIRDEPVPAPSLWNFHTKYFAPSDRSEEHLAALREAVGLASLTELRGSMSTHSPLLYLPDEI